MASCESTKVACVSPVKTQIGMFIQLQESMMINTNIITSIRVKVLLFLDN